LERFLDREVDLSTPEALHLMLKGDIMKDVVYA